MKSVGTVRGIVKELKNNSDIIGKAVSRKAEILRWKDDCVLSWVVVVLSMVLIDSHLGLCSRFINARARWGASLV